MIVIIQLISITIKFKGRNKFRFIENKGSKMKENLKYIRNENDILITFFFLFKLTFPL